MAAVYVFVLFYALGFLHQGLGLISDYKICGDPECASMMSRVQAQKDQTARDCRFLNFKKGDIITVYYKLTGKRSDLWAGSIDRLFGLFPKDAVRVEQRFVDEKKEIQVPTQEYDFFCFDENGSVIDSNTGFDDPEDVTQETQQAEINKAHNKHINAEDSDPSQISVQDVSDQNNPKTTEQGGSSWIGSAVSGLFGRNEQNKRMDEPQDGISDQQPFKSRKIAMNIKESHTDEQVNPGTFGWIRGELTSAFGFKKHDTQDNIKNPEEEKQPSSQQSSSWLSMGKDVLGFGKDNTADASKPEAETTEETNKDVKEQSVFNLDQPLDSVENIQKHENNPDHSVEDEDRPLDDDKTVEKAQTGWYGSIYNGFADLYSKKKSESDEDDKDSVSEGKGAKFVPNTEDNENTETESNSQSMFSVRGFSSVLDNIKFPFQSDTVVKSDVEPDNEHQTSQKEDTGKKESDEKQNEQTDISDPDKQDFNLPDADVINKTQSDFDESMILKDAAAASDSIEKIEDPLQDSSTQNYDRKESTASEISEIKSAENVIEDFIQSENNADISDKEMEENHLQRKEDKTATQVDSGEKDFFETQELPKKPSVASDDIQEMNDPSQEFTIHHDDTHESKDSEVFEIKSQNNLIEDVSQSKNNLTDSNTDILEDKMKQNLSDQENNSNTIKQQENDFDSISSISISTEEVFSSETDDNHTSELTDSALQTETELDNNEKQRSGFADSETDSNVETITTSQSTDSETIEDTLLEQNDDQILAGEDTGAEIKDDSLSTLDLTVKNETPSEASEVIMKNEEMLLDSGTPETEISNVNISNTSVMFPEDEDGYSLVHNHKTDELPVISEKNMHSDLEHESNSDLPIVEKEKENTSTPHDGLINIDRADISVRDDEVIEEQKEPVTFSASTENDLKTEELNTGLDSETYADTSKQNDTQVQNEYLSQEASTKDGFDGEYSDVNLTDIDDNGDTVNLQNKEDKDDSTGVPSEHISSTEAQITNDLFAENEPNSLQSAEQKDNSGMETDIANNEDHQTKVENVTGAIQDLNGDVDLTEKSEVREELPTQDNFASSAEFKPTQKPSKEYPNLHPHLTEQNIKELSDIVGEHKLSWLDLKMGNSSKTDTGQDNDDLAELNYLEQLLEDHMKTKTKPKHIQNQDGFPDIDNSNEYPALQKLSIIISTLREIYTPVRVDESPGSSQERCSHGACPSLNDNTQIITQEAENNKMTKDRSDVNDLSHPIDVPVSEEKDHLKNIIEEDPHVNDFLINNKEIRKHEDLTDFEIKKTTSQLNHGLVTEKHIQPEELQYGEVFTFLGLEM